MDSTNTVLPIEDTLEELAEPVLRYLQRYVGDHTLAQDLQQETLLRIARGLPTFAARSSLKTWAFSIANRVAADHFRRPEHRVRIVELDEAKEIVDPGREISVGIIADEMNRCVREVIDSLPESYRAALILYELEEISIEQTAETCECSVATAKIRIHRARQRLKEKLGEQCVFYRDGEGVYRCDRKA